MALLLVSLGRSPTSSRGRMVAAFQTTQVGRRTVPWIHHAESRRVLPVSTTTTTTTRQWLSSSTTNVDELQAQIKAKGDEIRALKEGGADKATVAPLVQELLALKAQLEPPAAASNTKNNNKKKKKDEEEKSSSESDESDFITSRSTDYSKWYNDLIRVTGLAENSPVRGCMVIKPWGMSIWDRLRNELDAQIQNQGAQNAYFPLLIPQSFLSKEAEHVDGFAKECAVVTHHRLTTNPNAGTDGTTSRTDLIPDPDAQLEEPLIVRPTSETMIWHTFRKWIQSHRDLPLKINQWANVMRWELRTRPFLRTSEFLWQEGHTAHATADDAEQEAQRMIQVYAQVCRDFLALPVVTGVKSPSERFAGAQETYTIEALMPNGWALQSGTSHFLGQSFGNAFNVTYQDEQGHSQVVWGTSWGVSTRLLGALIMTHSDDAGLVLPPPVAPLQVVIVTIPLSKKQAADEALVHQMDEALTTLKTDLEEAGVRVQVDARDYLRPGAKYFEWERKGVPLRMELGPRDVQQGSCVFKYRAPADWAADKQVVPLAEAATTAVQGLNRMYQALYEQADARLQQGIRRYDENSMISYSDFTALLQDDVASQYPGEGLFLVPWMCNAENEAQVKQDCQATLRCYPLDENENQEAIQGKRCFYSGEPATHMALFGRAF